MLALPILLAAFSLRASALNDWTVPCTDGTCSYDWVGDGNEKAFSSLALDGSRQLLSDVTPAAGWKVMDCNPDWKDGPHDIRLVCDGSPDQMSLCDHVFQDGAENTVVRLPQNCGVGPFARVNKVWVPTNQTIPDHIKRDLVGRATNVRGMTLDYDFKSVPESKGKLNFAITSSNKVNPVLNRRQSDLRRRGRDRYLHRRGFLDSIKDGIEGAASAVTNAAKTAATSVADGASAAASVVSSVATEATSAVTSVATDAATAVTDAGKAVATAASKAADKAANATSFNKTETGKDVPVKFDKNFTIIDSDISCVNFKNDISAHVHLDVDAHMNAKINYGYTLVGSLVPFHLDDMAVFASLSGKANMTFGVGLEATGQLDTFPVEMFKIGMPGLSIPGVGALGPELKLEYRLTMDVDIAAQMDIHANFDFGNVNMVFPENKGNSTATSKPVKSDNTVQISTANTGSDFSGTIEAILIPSVNFGIDLNVVSAAVFLEMEVGAEMEMIGTSGIGGPPAVEADADSEDSTDDGATTDDDSADATATDDSAADPAAETDDTGDDTAADDSTSTGEDADAAADDQDVDESNLAARTTNELSPNQLISRAKKAPPPTSDAVSAEDEVTTEDDTAAESDTTDEAAAGDETATEDDTATDDDTATGDDTATEDDTTDDDTTDDAATEDDAVTDDTATEDDATDDTATEEDDTTAQDDTADDAGTDDASAASNPLTGCVRVNGVMEMNYGLRGTIVPLFPQSLKFPLLSTKKELFTKCFGGSTPDILDQLSEEATDLESTDGEVGLAADDAAAGDATSGDDTATDEDPAAADGTDTAPARRKRHVLSIRQRRHLASLERRDFLGDLESTVAAAVPALTTAALNVLVCPSSFLPFGAFAALPI